MKTKAVTVKNMVCNRCIKVIKEELSKNNIPLVNIRLGEIELDNDIFKNNESKIKDILRKEGFELVESREARLINKVKSLIIESIHYGKEKPAHLNFSDFISKHLNVEYSYISKLFSEIEGKTIEKYIIEQKIERVKELLIYDELNLTEISYELDYNSPQYLSRQFKQITGFTPTQFKKNSREKRKKLDKI